MGFWGRLLGLQTRAEYARTNADLLVNDPDGFPSAYPAVHWLGLDSGGGSYPIGPHGPYEDPGYCWGPGWTGTSWAPAVPAVTRATALITGPLTAAPFGVKDTTGERKPMPRPRWLTDPMLLRPDDRVGGQVYPAVTRLPRAGFWSEWLRSAIWHGEGAFIFVADATGQPTPGTMRVIHPDALETDRDDSGALHWVLNPEGSSERVIFDRDGSVTIGPVTWQIVVLRNPHSPVDVDGRSRGVFEMHPQTFRLGRQLATYQAGQFRSGVPNGYLKVTYPDLEQDEATNLKRRWMEAHGGDRRSIAVLNSTTDFKPLNVTPVDSGLDQVKRLNLADVAFAFGLDPSTLGASLSTSNTYSNVRDAWQNHKDFGLPLWIAGVQDTLSALLPLGQDVAVQLDGVANPSMKDRFDAYKVAIDAGILTLEEVRAMEALPPAGGEEA